MWVTVPLDERKSEDKLIEEGTRIAREGGRPRACQGDSKTCISCETRLGQGVPVALRAGHRAAVGASRWGPGCRQTWTHREKGVWAVRNPSVGLSWAHPSMWSPSGHCLESTAGGSLLHAGVEVSSSPRCKAGRGWPLSGTPRRPDTTLSSSGRWGYSRLAFVYR